MSWQAQGRADGTVVTSDMAGLMAKMTIALVNHAREIGGAETALLRLVGALGERHEFAAFLPQEGPLAAELRGLGVRVEIVPMPVGSLTAKRANSWRLLGAFLRDGPAWPRRIRALASAVRPVDLVVTGSTKAHLYGGLAARMAGRPLVWWLHDTVDGTTFGILARMLIRGCARRLPHRILAVSITAASSLKLPPGDPRARVVYNGVRERPAVRDPGGDRVRVPATPTVGWIGRLVPSKGPDAFLQMAARVSAQLPSVGFVVVGAGDPREGEFVGKLRQMAEELGIGRRVEFLGHRSDLGPVLDRLSVLAFTSVTSDSLPTVILEAMAAGVPVVAFSGGGVEEIIEDGRSGYRVPRGEVDVMAHRVVSLLRRPEERKALGLRARERIRDAFGWDRWVDAWERELADVTGSGLVS